MHYAIQFQKKVDKLVLVDNAGLIKGVIWTLRMMSLPLVGELFSYPTRRGIEIFFKLAVRNRALVTKDLVELYYDIFSQPGFQKYFLRILLQIVNIRGAREEILGPIMNNLQKITQPVLIIWGEKDRVLPLKHGQFAKEKLRNAKLEIMEGCGHIPFFERSEEFNRAVLSFLSE